MCGVADRHTDLPVVRQFHESVRWAVRKHHLNVAPDRGEDVPDRAHGSPSGYRVTMTWILQTPMLLVAGGAAVLILPTLLRRPVSTPRLVVETFGTTLGVFAVVWLGWVALWLLEQRWYGQSSRPLQPAPFIRVLYTHPQNGASVPQRGGIFPLSPGRAAARLDRGSVVPIAQQEVVMDGENFDRWTAAHAPRGISRRPLLGGAFAALLTFVPLRSAAKPKGGKGGKGKGKGCKGGTKKCGKKCIAASACCTADDCNLCQVVRTRRRLLLTTMQRHGRRRLPALQSRAGGMHHRSRLPTRVGLPRLRLQRSASLPVAPPGSLVVVARFRLG
jgi:hypothetical protein